MIKGISPKLHAVKLPLCVAISVALASPSAYSVEKAQSLVKSISLIKRVVEVEDEKDQAENHPVEISTKTQQFHLDIARQLNRYPGIFAVNIIPNGQTPLITNNSSGLQHAVSTLTDDLNLAPVSYIDRSLYSLSPLISHKMGRDGSPKITNTPTGLVGSLTTETGMVPSEGPRMSIDVEAGDDAHAGFTFDYGHRKDRWGHLFQYSAQQGDSYRSNRLGQQGGFKSNDLLLKIIEQGSNIGAKNQQLTQFSLLYRDYDNDESRYGISYQDSLERPELRYSATAGDNEKTDQLSLRINHQIVLATSEIVMTDLYYDSGNSSYYQTSAVSGVLGDSAIDLLSGFERNPLGTLNVTKQSFDRSYSSGGIQVRVSQQIGLHNLQLGVRYHNESVDDKSYNDAFLFNQDLSLSLLQSNQEADWAEQSVNARTVFISDEWTQGPLTLAGGYKYEKIEIEKEFPRSFFESESTHTLGNVGLNYKFSSSLDFFITAHQGLLPSNNLLAPEAAQTSDIYRAGIDHRYDNSQFTFTVFKNEFYNVFARCFTIENCKEMTDDRFDIEISGAEMVAAHTFELDNMSIPLTAVYTYRDHNYGDELDVTNIEHVALPGDELAYIPQHQLYLELGAKFNRWDLMLKATHRSEQRLEPGLTSLTNVNKIDAVTLVDLTANVAFDRQQKVFLTVNNLTDQEYVESAYHAGRLMGRGSSILLGYRYTF
ncbi:TonB-dependent receptor domain-containing protein [Psychrobium sp. 1_MG-2023]|uniref:TonB-dependent receptor domain-containing protein n=1 Tax=Psychrobium sp. 1_MG-2023 TaxID=3062624 RepID=UPI000C348CD3|nr:TonB-dependent receptor [Psychrobium sp. 1_MG-2023]MDP2560028.1 TonB-dependent receptor [Psychrobium sp. 1_MG-2023]PKF56310.1 hypothetical protein CW748_10120 [Alteromonadales bacterium alter-6D02]